MAEYAPLKRTAEHVDGSAEIIDGKAVAARGARARSPREVEELRGRPGVTPGLATILVGDDPASAVYVRTSSEACAEVGIESLRPRACRRRRRTSEVEPS